MKKIFTAVFVLMFVVTPVLSRAEEVKGEIVNEKIEVKGEVKGEEVKDTKSDASDETRGSGTDVYIKMFLGGPYSPTTGYMSTALNDANLIPLSEPYTFLDYQYVGGDNFPFLDPAVFDVMGVNAIVDWVFVEFRNSADMAEVLYSRPALLQADGDVVDYDGVSPIVVDLSGEFYVSVGHRNHLQIMTQSIVDISEPIDLSTIDLFGNDAAQEVGGVNVLWAGDANRDGMLKYTGTANDRDIVLFTIGGTVPTAFVSGYFSADTNMSGVVKYTGINNDRDLILSNIYDIGGINAVRHAQIIN